MNREQKKALIAAYKERKPGDGVFAVICGATGEAWVGCSRRLDTHQNRLWFALRTGTSPHRTLQAAWTSHGEAAFRFEELDRLEGERSQSEIAQELTRRLSLWRERLKARVI
ncbi:MAG: GIY-YIG nuclease family protein [Alphaproteobacteria bacterium]|nr:GIY-YIG nuclease family protein [Alphaproteobacteria bacterium]